MNSSESKGMKNGPFHRTKWSKTGQQLARKVIIYVTVYVTNAARR
jgi:hypothetical protein